MRLRHQLAAYSPISLGGLVASANAAVSSRKDPREQLRRDVAQVYLAETEQTLLTASGTHALQFALATVRDRLGGDKRVGLPAFCCYDIATAAVGVDSSVELYDIDPATLAPDLDSLERVLSAGVRVVVVAPLFGVPVEWEAIQACAAAHDAIVIEDAALGHGATYRDRPLGTLGNFSIVSFGRGKGWTGGSGGAFFARNRGARGSISSDGLVTAGESRNVAALLAQWALGRPAVYGIPRALPLGLGSTHYREPDSTRSMTRAAASALLASREMATREADYRRAAGERILGLLSGEIPAAVIRVPARGRAGYLRFPLRLSRGMASFGDESEALAGGISPTYPTTLGELPQIRLRMGDAEKKWPGATALVRELVTLPVHSRLRRTESESNIRLVLKTVGK